MTIKLYAYVAPQGRIKDFSEEEGAQKNISGSTPSVL